MLVRLLAAGALVGAATLGLVMVLAGLAVVGRIPAVAALDEWSVTELASTLPIPVFIGAPAAALGVWFMARTLWRTGGITRQLVRSHQLSRTLRSGGGPIVVVDDETAEAYTVAGILGCVVLSRQLLGALTPSERRVVIAHELSHLRHRHHLYVHAVDIAIAANPFLRPASRAVRLGVERWADEDAARTVGNRRNAALTLASAALTRSALRSSGVPRPRPGAVLLGVADSDVTRRALALLRPLPRGRLVVSSVLLLAVASLFTVVMYAMHIHHGFELAEPCAITAGEIG